MHNTIYSTPDLVKFKLLFWLVKLSMVGRLYVYSNCDTKTGNGIGVSVDNLWVLCINKIKKVWTKDIKIIYIVFV